MNKNLYFYRIMPGVVKVGEQTEVTISAVEPGRYFPTGKDYRIDIYPTTRNQRGITKIEERKIRVKAKNKKLKFTFTFDKEEEYYIMIYEGESKEKFLQMSIYALEEDMYNLRPLKGDMHCHSCPSDVTMWRKKDGADTPAVIPAEYRKAGFDFMTLTDHDRYFGSVEMNKVYSKVKLGLLMNRGEEVHAPKNYVHIVNFGGEHSVNEIFQNHPKKFEKEVQMIIDEDNPEYKDRYIYAVNKWVGQNIRKANGLAVFCHPHWISTVYNVSDELTKIFMEEKFFDAYEVVGAATFHSNNMKLAYYNQLKDDGVEMPPMVGSSDSHSQVIPYSFNKQFTVFFAEKNETKSIIKAVKEYRTAPVEVLTEKEYIVHGKYRYVSFARYLLEWYFPLTKIICEEEGNLMRQYILGIDGAAEELNKRYKNTEKFYKQFYGKTK